MSNPSVEELLATQCSAWHAALRKHTPSTRCIDLPPGFVRFLLADGVYLGDQNQAIGRGEAADDARPGGDFDSSSDDEQVGDCVRSPARGTPPGQTLPRGPGRAPPPGAGVRGTEHGVVRERRLEPGR